MNEVKGDFTMWVITVFEKKDVRIFEFTNKNEATKALEGFKKNISSPKSRSRFYWLWDFFSSKTRQLLAL